MFKKVFYNSKFAKIFLPTGYSTITLGCFIFTKYSKHFIEQNPKIINHENIHVEQWLEHTTLVYLLFIFYYFLDYLITNTMNVNHLCWCLSSSAFVYYIIYIFEFLINYSYYLFNPNRKLYSNKSTWYNAYRKISFELEAYNNQYNENYLKSRKDFASYSNFLRNYY